MLDTGCLILEFTALAYLLIQNPRPPRLPRPVPGRDGEGEADGGQAESSIQYRLPTSLNTVPTSKPNPELT